MERTSQSDGISLSATSARRASNIVIERGVSAVLLMPWKCPACSTQIRHEPSEETPQPRFVYRCHVCHLELKLDINGERLVPAFVESPDAA